MQGFDLVHVERQLAMEVGAAGQVETDEAAAADEADDLEFEAFTERIPAIGTPVLVILEPVLPPKKK